MLKEAIVLIDQEIEEYNNEDPKNTLLKEGTDDLNTKFKKIWFKI